MFRRPGRVPANTRSIWRRTADWIQNHPIPIILGVAVTLLGYLSVMTGVFSIGDNNSITLPSPEGIITINTPSEVSTTLTPASPIITATATLNATSTPKALNLPEGGVDSITEGGYTYAIDANNNKISRTELGKEQWQPRYDLPYTDATGKQLYEAWITKVESTNDVNCDPVAVDRLIASTDRHYASEGYSTIQLEYGCITKRTAVAVNSGTEEVKLILFDIQIPLKGNNKLLIHFSGMARTLNRPGALGVNIGQKVSVVLLLSTFGDGSFSDSLQERIKIFSHPTPLEFELSFGDDNSFYSFQEVLTMFKSVPSESDKEIDLTFQAPVEALIP